MPGAVFALEVLAVGQVQYAALVPCLLAAIVGDWTCHAWGIRHVAYHVAFSGVPEASGMPFHIDPLLTVKVALIGVASGLAGLVFSEASHRIGTLSRKLCPTPWLRPALGGLLVIGLVYAVGPTLISVKLEAFCRQHGGLLAEKVIVYKHLEHWRVGKIPSGQARLSEADVSDAAELNEAG